VNVTYSNTCMICFGQESNPSFDEYAVKCRQTRAIRELISASPWASGFRHCTELPDVMEVVQKSPINLRSRMLSHQRFVGINMVTVPDEIQ